MKAGKAPPRPTNNRTCRNTGFHPTEVETRLAASAQLLKNPIQWQLVKS